MHFLLLLPALKHCVTMEMGIFCLPRTVQYQTCLYIAADLRQSKIEREEWREKENTQDEIDCISLCYRGLYLRGLNPVLYEMEYIYEYIYIYTYNIQLRFNFKAAMNLFIL